MKKIAAMVWHALSCNRHEEMNREATLSLNGHSEQLPLIPVQETVSALRNFLDQEKGILRARVALRTDLQGIYRLRLDVYPTREYKQSSKFNDLACRVQDKVSKRTGISEAHIVIRRDLKPLD